MLELDSQGLKVSSCFVDIMLDQLALDVTYQILDSLPSPDRARLAVVCKSWEEFAFGACKSYTLNDETCLLGSSHVANSGTCKALNQLAYHSSNTLEELRIYWGQRTLTQRILSGKLQNVPCIPSLQLLSALFIYTLSRLRLGVGPSAKI